MRLYEVPLSMSLLGFGMGTMLASFDMCGIVHLSVPSIGFVCVFVCRKLSAHIRV